MKNYLLFLATTSILVACQASDSGGGAGSANDGKKKSVITSDATIPGSPTTCVPTPENNNCKPQTGSEECWAKLLNPPKLAACAAAGQMYNRLKPAACVNAQIKVKPNCTMQDVYSTMAAAGYPQAVVDASIAQLKQSFSTALKVPTEPVLDQCGTFTTPDGKTFLVPFFVGKAFAPGAGGTGDEYKFQAGKICDSALALCKDPSLVMTAVAGATPPTLSCQ